MSSPVAPSSSRRQQSGASFSQRDRASSNNHHVQQGRDSSHTGRRVVSREDRDAQQSSGPLSPTSAAPPSRRANRHLSFSNNQASSSTAPTFNLNTSDDMPAAYAVRDGGDAKSKKQSMADLKLRRLQELNSRLKEDLERPRVKVAEASMSLINYCNQTRDYMVPSVWGQVDRKEDPYNPQSGGGSEGCCIVM